jgi:hypothetical protein
MQLMLPGRALLQVIGNVARKWLVTRSASKFAMRTDMIVGAANGEPAALSISVFDVLQ